MSHHARIAPVLLAAVAVALAFALPSAADFDSVPAAWTSFPTWYPLTYGGIATHDFENTGGCADPTNGGSAFSSETDISSGGAPYDVANCNPQFPPGICCGTATSAFWSYFNGGGPSDPNTDDDFLALRMRVNGDPRDASDDCLTPSHWNFLHDWDNDGFKELWYDAWGNENEIRILYEDNNSQQVSNDDPAPAPGTLINLLTACAVRAPAPGQTICGSAANTRDCFYSHSRVCGVPASPADLINPSICSPTTDTTGEWFVEVQVPINFLRTNAPPAQCCTSPIVLGPRVFTTFPPPIHLFFSTSDSSINPIQKDFIAACDTTNGPCTFSDPTPVSLSYFHAERGGSGLVIEWSTASESGNVGFDLYVERDGAWRKLTARPVESRRPFSLARVDYRLELPGASGERFLIEDLDLSGERRRHGPFEIETAYGSRRPAVRPDWAAIRAEHERNAAARAAARPARRATTGAARALSAPARPVVDLLVDRDGIYRVTHEQLAAAGFDFSGVPASALAVSLQGRAVPVRVGGPARFGRGSFVELVGEAADGLYTRANVYRLRVDPAQAARVALPAAPAAISKQGPAGSYLASNVVDQNLEWTFGAPGDDPWYRDWVTAFAGAPETREYSFTVDRLVPGDATLVFELWGMTDWAAGPDHHVRISLNGQKVAERRFDGLAALALEIPLHDGLLLDGENRVVLTLPVDTGVDFEVVAVDRFGARFPRALVARDGALAFDLRATTFTVDGFGDARALAYQRDGERVTFLGAVPTSPTPLGRSATFRTATSLAVPAFAVAQPSALLVPGLRAAALAPELRRQPAQYLVIAHPDFLGALEPLVAARRAEGRAVQVADVEKVYGEFGHGRFGADAIRSYIDFAAARLGTEMVLLVGADTYDYLGFGGTGSISFVPTLYAELGRIVRGAPADALFGDIDRDGVPELPVGRFPVRTAAEAALLVGKTLAYPTAGHAGTALLAADGRDFGADFSAISDATFALLPGDWTIERDYVDTLGVAGARSALLAGLDRGVAFVQYVGHSAPDYWSFSGLFTREDAQALANAGRPSVFAQWGCWNTFFVAPDAATLADRLLTGGDRGAVAVLGPAALAASDSHRQMSELLARALFEDGLELGPALAAARRELAASRPWMIDVVRGVNLLGDPALRVAP